MDFDEYDYLEKAVESPEDGGEEEGKSSRRDREREDEDGGDGRDGKKSAGRSKGEVQNGKGKDRDGAERSSRSERRERDHHREARRGEREQERERMGAHHGRRDREHREREGEKDRGREKERESETDGGREREREWSRRSSSRSGRHEREEAARKREKFEREKAERERERGRSKERAAREKEIERGPKEKENRRVREKKEVVEAEVDPERDLRTVFAYQMPLRATERDVYEFFSKAGKVRDVRLIMDRNSRRSKGVGYVEFYDVLSVPNAIALSGQLLFGQPVMVKPSEAEKNLAQSNVSAGSALSRKLYVGNLHFNMSEELLRQVFEPFGPVELVQLPLDLETGQCKGFGFVQFAQLEHAKAAQSLNGKLEIAGRVIKVSAVTDHVGVQDAGANAADFDDDDGGGLTLNAQARAMLMQKLDRTGTVSSIAGSLGVPVPNGLAHNQQTFGLSMNGQSVIPSALPTLTTSSPVEPIGDPSECILLKNMFDPSTETDPEFDLDLKEEVQKECSKFGPVKHIFVDKYSQGHVYLQFSSVAAAMGCQKAMHMRWFACRALSATFMRPSEYEAKFKA
ncbi:unnamed protein product [Spirodela intermedia]|uniref:RRM domain-containing protein n=1 Tax=Spirodela intermedia TaxID=51605 RepID=A0A7I8L7H5_SPIIN|nr:unnamed protein product [Spirodela intermedia]